MTDDMFGLGKWLGNYFLSHRGWGAFGDFHERAETDGDGNRPGATGRPLPKAMTKRLSPQQLRQLVNLIVLLRQQRQFNRSGQVPVTPELQQQAKTLAAFGGAARSHAAYSVAASFGGLSLYRTPFPLCER
ncbi:hypothetical protein [Paraburkholderia sp. RL17-347-BIC-D]